jgi:membrane-associated phospholipid phosphatase
MSAGSSEADFEPKDPESPLAEAGPLGTAAATPAPTPATPPPAPELGLATITVVAGFAVLVASLFVLGSIAEGIRSQEVFALDTWATPFLHGIASPGLDTFMNFLTDLGSILVIPPLFVLVAGWLLWRRRLRASLFLGVASLGSLVLQGTMKLFFARPRPLLPWAQVLPDFSFPSGHTMNGVVFYGAVALILWSVYGRRVGLVAVVVATIIALGVGTSRIYLGYHYLTDVVGGILAGLAWLVVVGAAFRARPTWRRWRASRLARSSSRAGPGPAAAR